MLARPASLGLQVLWGFTMLGLGLLATGLQIDRQSEHSPRLAVAAPAMLRSDSLAILADSAYAAGNTEAGLHSARQFIRRRPYPATGLSLLGQGLLETNDYEPALRALQLSAQRGWRDNWTQYLMIASALEVRDPTTVAQRLLALLRRKSEYEALGVYAKPAMLDPATRSELIKGILASDVWGTDFFEWASTQDIPTAALEDLAQGLADKGAQVDCTKLSAYVRAQASRGGGEAAHNIWSSLCGNADNPAANDLTFHDFGKTVGPYAWRYSGDAELSESSPTRLQYDNREHRYVHLARRLMTMAPGEHTLRLDAISDDPSAPPLTVRIQCFATDGTHVAAARALLNHGTAQFTLPNTGCVAQELSILAGYGSGSINLVQLEN